MPITTLVETGTRMHSRESRALFSLFAIDTRALAVVRIGLASILIYQVLTTPLPSASAPLIDYSLIAALPFALALLLGYRTRLAVAACWALYGLPLRPDLFDGVVPLESYMLTLFLFWGFFLPLGAHLSVDSRRGASHTRKGLILSVGSAGFLIQVFLIYFSAGVTKYMPEWVTEASALETIFALPAYANDLGRAMLAFPTILAIGSVLTVVLEVLGSLLLMAPGKTLALRRTVITLAFILFHVALAVFMSPIGRFPYVMMVAWVVFLPSVFWDRITRRPVTAEPYVDTGRIRNVGAGFAIVYIVISNLITWMYYPANEGFPAVWQAIGKYLLIYQQWAMFSVPSSL
ncbi:MAG: HTTM domain-containing protein [Actinobacteria bacterium]|nr:HTTM domain-containing protein [Actinomycetota bacterium]